MVPDTNNWYLRNTSEILYICESHTHSIPPASDLSSIDYYTPADNRPEFLTALGMKNAAIIRRISPSGAFYGQISAERSSELKSDVLVTYADKASDVSTFEHNALIEEIPAIASGHLPVTSRPSSPLGVR